MKRERLLMTIALVILLLLPLAATLYAQYEQGIEAFEIPFTKFFLDNGLTLIVHEDHKAPIVAVNVSYHVGSKDEKPGKTGFAHLIEHLMFNGSENSRAEWVDTTRPLGVMDENGETWFDRTDFFETVPVSALDSILWLESDRMGHLLGAVTQDQLDEQRGVVINELKQIESESYGMADNHYWRYIYPKGHPYSWPAIGSIEDLERVTMEDVREWFATYYNPSNAVLVIAGDVNTEEVKRKVENYFGNIAAGPRLSRFRAWTAKRTEETRAVFMDNVARARIRLIWNIPNWGSKDTILLKLAGDILAGSKTSVLYRRLVEEGKYASSVAADVELLELGSVFSIEATVMKSDDVKIVEKIIKDEVKNLIDVAPSEENLQLVKVQHWASFIREAEKVGGFNGKAQILARAETLRGDAGSYSSDMKIMFQASPEEISAAAREWLSSGEFIEEVHPMPAYKMSGVEVDRSKMPLPAVSPQPELPEIQRSKLSNGLEIILVERHAVPIIRMNLLVNAGYAADKFFHSGTAVMTTYMLAEGTTSRTSEEISKEIDLLGSRIVPGANFDFCSVAMMSLRMGFDRSLDIFADVILYPKFPEEIFETRKKAQLSGIAQEKTSPIYLALRYLPQLLYGKDHAYATPLSGTGTEQSVSAITRESLVNFHQTWFRPNNATLLIIGDITMREVKPKLEEQFKEWKPGDVPEIIIDKVPLNRKQITYLIDRPNASQSNIYAAQLMVPKLNDKEHAITIANEVLAASSTGSRIGKNIREDKHWAYSTFSVIVPNKGQRFYLISAQVQKNKTAESIAEIRKEISGFIGDHPITPEELDRAKKNATLTIPGDFETGSNIIGKIVPIIRFGLSDDYYNDIAGQINSLTVEEVTDAAREVFRPDGLIWLIVGDMAAIENDLKNLDIGPLILLKVNGDNEGGF